MSKIIITVVTIAFAGFFLWTLVSGAPLSGAAFYTDPWVALGMADLMYGFVLMSVIIALVEGSAARATPWIIALFIIGNLVAAAFLLMRFDKITAPFSKGEQA